MRKKVLPFIVVCCFFLLPETFGRQQTNTPNLASYFEEAYARYPTIPAGILEATAYAASHMVNLNPQEDEANCTGMPDHFGIFGLVENGKGYFRNNLVDVCRRSGITPAQFKKDVRLQILAVAQFLHEEAGRRISNAHVTDSREDFASVLESLTEIPDDGSEINTYARSLFTYEIYSRLQRGFSTPSLQKAPQQIDLKKNFPEKTLQRLQAPALMIDYRTEQIVTHTNATSRTNLLPDVTLSGYPADRPTNSTQTTATAPGVSLLSADYPPALWNPAASCNITAGRGGSAITHIGIHTMQGTYAGTISWFKNCGAEVSAHYLVRSSDGQVTQMVSEGNMAWHIRNHNNYTLGIEHEGWVDNPSWYTEALYQSSAALVRDMCNSYGIDASSCYSGPASATYSPIAAGIKIKGHQHYVITNAKTDPGINWNWGKFANLIKPFVMIPDGTYRITNVGSGKVLNGRTCSGNNGTILEQWDWNGADCQRWLFQHMGDGWYRISSRITGRMLDVDRCLPGDGVTVQLWDWLNNDCQRWKIQDWGNGQIRLINKASGKLLDVNNGSTANGVQVWQWSTNGTNAQRWTLTQVSSNFIADGTYRIRLGRNNKVMQPANGSIAPATAMVQSDWLDSSYQKWNIEATPDGWYKFTAAGGQVLDLNICNQDNGGKVMLWDWLNNDCQRWSFEGLGNGLWAIISKASGKVLDAPDPDNGGRVYQWQWLNNINQQWYVDPVTAANQLTTFKPNSSSQHFLISPNPVSVGRGIRLEYRSDVASQPATIVLSDLHGLPLRQQKVTLKKGINLFSIPTNNLRAGIYTATILLRSNQKESKKVIVIE